RDVGGMSAGRCEPAGHERDGSAAAAQRLRPWIAGNHDHRPGRRAHRRRGDAGRRVGLHRKAGRPQRAAGQHWARARAVAGCNQAPGLARSGSRPAGEPHAAAARDHGSSLGRPPEQEHRGRSRHQPADCREPSCRGHAQGGRVVAAGPGPTGGRRRRTWVVSEAAKPRSTASNFAPRPVTSRGWRQSASVRPPPGRRTWEKLTMAGPTGALTHAGARIDPSTTKIHLVGGGIASLAAAAFFIHDGGVLGHNITVYEELATIGGSLDGSGSAKDGYVLCGGRMFESEYVCTFALFDSIPTLDATQTVTGEILQWNKTLKTSSKARLVRGGKRQTAPAFETVQNVGGQAARRYGRLARHSAAVWSLSNVPFMTAVRTLSIRCAPRGDHRICCLAFILRCSSHCT